MGNQMTQNNVIQFPTRKIEPSTNPAINSNLASPAPKQTQSHGDPCWNVRICLSHSIHIGITHVPLVRLAIHSFIAGGAQSCTDLGHGTVPCDDTKKDITNKETNKTLSATDQLPDFLESYFSNVNLESKKQRVRKHFHSFKNQYPIDDIELVLKHVIE